MVPRALRPLRAARRASFAVQLSLLAAALAAACGGGSEQVRGAAALTSAPGGREPTGAVPLDPHRGGDSRAAVAEVLYGRLVDVYDRTGEVESLRYEDLVVDPELLGPEGPGRIGDGTDCELDFRAGRARLVVLHPSGTPAFDAAVARAAGGLVPFPAGALDPVSLPRDAALSVRFDDLVAVDELERGWQLVVERDGVPVPARVFADLHRAVSADGEGGALLTTRAVLDPLVSALDRLRDPRAPAEASGWPEAGPGGALELRVARRGERPGSGPAASFRSSGRALAAGAPRVLGEQAVDVLQVQPLGGRRVLVDYAFAVAACATGPAPGDLIEFPGGVGEVVAHDGAHDPSAGAITRVPLYLLAGSAASVTPGPALYVAPFDPAVDLPACFVRFSPQPSLPPAQGVQAAASLSVRFDRPMDPQSFEAFRTFTVQRGWAAPPLEQLVVGAVLPSLALDRFDFVPSVPLSTVAPVSPAAYVFDLDGSAGGLTGLDGTPLAADLPAVDFELDPNQAQQQTSGIALTFDQVDEDGNGSPELRGQFLLDLAAERILPRPVTRFSTAVDSTHPLVGFMTPIPGGVQTPLSGYGSRMTSLWRYVDLGFSLLDESYHNLDVEGLHWSPDSGQPLLDDFSEFEMTLGHAGYLPDEDVDNGLLPKFSQSGLVNTFDANQLDPSGTVVVHPKAAGYHVDPLDLTTSAGGTPLMPWPMNQGVPSSQFTYWTWRDTGVQAVGGPFGVGCDPARATAVLGGQATVQGLYGQGEVPTIGLPLLAEFRTWPDSGALGLNRLKITIAINSSANPYFRTFSTGGLLNGGGVKLVDPDLEQVGTGGVNPFTGQPTPSRDNAFYIGQADFVVRVSRAHTVWFDTGVAQAFGPPVVEPAPQFQPVGTQVALAFRGADAISAQVPSVWETTQWIDPYGDSFDAAQIVKLAGSGAPDESFTVSFLNGDPGWKSDPSELDGARFLQARITMISNAETGLTPSVTGLGIGFVN